MTGRIRILAAAVALLVTSAPTALSSSPSPSPGVTFDATGVPSSEVRGDILPGVMLEVMEVGRGAFRVLGDEVRDLTELQAHWIASGRDGSVWLGSAAEPEAGYRLGGPMSLERPIVWGKLRVAPDGTIWIIERAPRSGKRLLSSFDGEAWQHHRLPKRLRDASGPLDIDVGADGTLWVVSANRVGHLGPTEWQVLKGRVPTQGLVVTDVGEPWSSFFLQRYEDGAWRQLGLFDEQGYVGHDGTVWAQGGRSGDGIEHLELIGDEGRTTCPVDAQPYGFVPFIDAVSVAKDGSLWGVYGMGPRLVGLARFDCQSWQYPLPEIEVGPGAQIAFSDDGSVWVLAAPLAPEEDTPGATRPHRIGTHRELYVITPEATAPK